MWHNRRARYSTKNDDAYFPFSMDVINLTDKGVLSSEMAQHLDPPISVLTNMHYPQLSTNSGDVIIPSLSKRIAVNTPLVNRNFGIEESYKAMSGRDLNYFASWTKLVPSGMIPYAASSNAYFTPFVENLSFNYIRTSDDIVYQSNSNLHELLAVIESQVIKGGCPEIPLTNRNIGNQFCCEAFTKVDHINNIRLELMRHNVNRFEMHQLPQCPTNNHYDFTVCDMDVNDKTEDSSDYIHAFSFRTLQNECSSQIYASHQAKGFDISYANLLTKQPARIEVGFKQIDSAVQMSLDKHSRDKRIIYHHPYLNCSRKYQSETKRYFRENGGIAGPPLANLSQAYSLAKWARKMEKEGRWMHSELTSHVKTMPIYDPSMSVCFMFDVYISNYYYYHNYYYYYNYLLLLLLLILLLVLILF